MITPFIQLLKELQLNSTAEEVADTLWLASFLDPPVEEEVESPPKGGRGSSSGSPKAGDDHATDSRPLSKKVRATVSSPNWGERATDVPTVRGLPLAAPTLPALPNTLAIEQALRPLMRRVPSRTHVVLHEEATVQRIADEDNWVPIMRPAPSRWLDVVLVVDESPSMVIWQETIVEWERLLKRLGAFRKVQSWGFMSDSDGEQIQLYAGIGPHADRSRGREPHELIDPYGQHLILVMSDCVSPAWYQKPIIEMLESWAQKGPVGIVQMLPERLWSRTALGDAVRVDLRAPSAGTPNKQLEVDSIWSWFDDEDDEENAYYLEAPAAEFPMPVVTLEARTLKPWAKSLAGRKLWIPGVLFSKSAFDESPRMAQESASQSTTDTVSARQLFQRFKATTSPTARQLAGYLAAVPLTLPIMRIVQREMLPDSTPDHLAEVLLSGLIQQEKAIHSHDLRYDFVEGIRDFLLSTILISETVDVLDLVFKKISNFIDRKTGQGPDFRALVANPEAIGQIEFEAGGIQFATIATKVLRRLGGNYAKLAKRLEERVNSSAPTTTGGGEPTQTEVWRLLNAEFPDKMAQGQQASLLVWLARETGENLSRSVPIGSDVDIVTQIRRGLALVGSGEGQLTVTDEDETLPMQFKLRATEIGPARIRVLCFQGGQPLGAVTLSSIVVEADEYVDDERNSQERSLAPFATTQPNLTLRIVEQYVQDQLTIKMELHALDPEWGLNWRPFGPITLQMKPQQYFQDFFRDIERLTVNTPEKQAIAAQRLALKGAGLFKDLLPEELRVLLWELRHRIRTMQVLSDNPWIPWEMIQLQGEEDGELVGGPFLCEAFAITRWFSGIGRRPTLRLKRMAMIVPADSRLKYAKKERDYLRSLANQTRQVSEITPTYLDVLDALSQGKHDSWHFTGHGRLKRSRNYNRAAIKLQDDKELYADEISGRVRNCGQTQPLVFLNAAQTVAWAKRFIDAGAAAFIGSKWSVDDEAAYEFAKAFYNHLLAGETIGEAVWKARRAIRQRNDSNWLAYTVFADSLARVVE